MDAAELKDFTDGELIALIERLDTRGHDRSDLAAALDELFRRIRAEAAPDERLLVEAAIARLTWLFTDDDDGPYVDGVREPRRPPPDFGAGSVHLAS